MACGSERYSRESKKLPLWVHVFTLGLEGKRSPGLRYCNRGPNLAIEGHRRRPRVGLVAIHWKIQAAPVCGRWDDMQRRFEFVRRRCHKVEFQSVTRLSMDMALVHAPYITRRMPPYCPQMNRIHQLLNNKNRRNCLWVQHVVAETGNIHLRPIVCSWST